MFEWYMATPAEFRALMGCFLFAVNQILARRLSERTSVISITVFMNLTVGGIALFLSLMSERYEGNVPMGVLSFAGVGVIGLGMARYTGYFSNKLVGVSRTNAFISASPVGASLMGVFLLGEWPGPAVWLGTALVVAGLAFMTGDREAAKVPWEWYFYPLLAMLSYAVTPFLRKVALGFMNTLWLGLAIAAFVSVLCLLAASRFLPEAQKFRFGRRMLLASVPLGLVSLGAGVNFWSALRDGQLSVVAPLVRLNPIFALVLSLLFLKGMEVINRRVVVATLIVVTGAVLITSGS